MKYVLRQEKTITPATSCQHLCLHCQRHPTKTYLDLHVWELCQQLRLVHIMLPCASQHGDGGLAGSHCLLQGVLQG